MFHNHRFDVVITPLDGKGHSKELSTPMTENLHIFKPVFSKTSIKWVYHSSQRIIAHSIRCFLALLPNMQFYFNVKSMVLLALLMI